jgi:hypothetical protein
LFRYVCLNSQDQVIDSEKVWLELKTTPAESLKQAVPVDKWDDYCMKQQENARIKLEKDSVMQLQQNGLQIQQKKDELADKETARLKQLQGKNYLIVSRGRKIVVITITRISCSTATYAYCRVDL